MIASSRMDSLLLANAHGVAYTGAGGWMRLRLCERPKIQQSPAGDLWPMERETYTGTKSEKESEWTDSMSWLMKKLEQLNLDIEEALSGGSSPSSTPSSKRHKQLCPIQVETGFYGDHQEKGSWKNKRGDYQDLDCLPYPVSTGARPKTDFIYEYTEHISVRLSAYFLVIFCHGSVLLESLPQTASEADITYATIHSSNP
ncbi:hypothetical protein BTVI_142212 [Pitangus sulphuratus]|nr:hypothetical protein BTVI_142212 [Pitangus sulphuratus]